MSDDPGSLQVHEYLTPSGRSPFREWLQALDESVRQRIAARLLRFEQGQLGDCRCLRGELWEARLHCGAGYRVYFGRDGSRIVILLGGGDKRSQERDIARARFAWNDYRRLQRHEP